MIAIAALQQTRAYFELREVREHLHSHVASQHRVYTRTTSPSVSGTSTKQTLIAVFLDVPLTALTVGLRTVRAMAPILAEMSQAG
jgi:hypothetical protein